MWRAASPLKVDELNCRVAMDMIYRPRTTPLLRLGGEPWNRDDFGG
jgi:shikimate 5-dehydrogenase